MAQPNKEDYQQGDLSPADQFKNKKKSNRIYGIVLGLFVLFMASLAVIL